MMTNIRVHGRRRGVVCVRNNFIICIMRHIRITSRIHIIRGVTNIRTARNLIRNDGTHRIVSTAILAFSIAAVIIVHVL